MKTYMIMLDHGYGTIIQEFKATNADDALGDATDYFKSLFPHYNWNKIPLKIVHNYEP